VEVYTLRQVPQARTPEGFGETMKIRTSFIRRFVPLAVAGILVVVLAACTGRGGGYLPPKEPAGFTGQAPFGFTFSCEDSGGINPPTGQLRIQLAYSDQGTSLLAKSPFGIHGIVDTIDPVLESMICQGQEPPPGGNELIFLGRYRFTSGSPPASLAGCKTTTPLCRFEVEVHDNDGNLAPSRGDFFSIQLSSATALTSILDPATVFYARAGYLAGGNLTVR
jgi:hypothetical protein